MKTLWSSILINTLFSFGIKDKTTVADWYSTDLVITQIRDQDFETLGWPFDFLLKLQKLGRVFEKFSIAFETLGRAF